MKQNQDACTQLLEGTHTLLEAIILMHVDSDSSGELPPSVLHNIGRLTQFITFLRVSLAANCILFRTLHQIHTFVEAQQNSSKFKNFFRQGEISSLLKDCRAGLQQGMECFKVT